MTETREETLHAAVCQALALMNVSPAVARDTEARQAKDILREALIAWADAPPAQAQPSGDVERVLLDRKAQRERFDIWWRGSKYMQVIYASLNDEQIAWDAWQAALAAPAAPAQGEQP